MTDFFSVWIGLSISAAIGNFTYTIYLWLRYGEWVVVSLGWWLRYLIEVKEISTGWKGADIILNWLAYQINASFPLIIIAIIGIFVAAYFDGKDLKR